MYATLTHVHYPFMCSVGETKNVSDDFWVRSLFVQRRMLLVMHCHVGSLGCSLVRRFRGACCVCNTVTVFLFFSLQIAAFTLANKLLGWRYLSLLASHNCIKLASRQFCTHEPRTCAPIPSQVSPTLCPCLQWPFVQSPTPEPATWDPYLARRREVVGDLKRRC